MLSLTAPVTVDPAACTVTVAAGATWAQVDAATQRHGLAVTGARVSGAPVELGGDGWLVRSMGLISDNLVGARTVAGEDAGDELLAVLRGTATLGGLASVTLRLRPLGPLVLAGARVHPAAHAPAVLRAYRDALASAPDEVGGGIVLTRDAAGVLVLGGDVLGVPLAPTPYRDVQRLLDPLVAPRRCRQAGLMAELDDDAIDVFALLAGELTGGHILLQPLGGAYASPDLDTPVGHRDAGWAYCIEAGWSEARDDAAETAWALAAAAELAPHDLGVAFPGLATRRDRTALAA